MTHPLFKALGSIAAGLLLWAAPPLADAASPPDPAASAVSRTVKDQIMKGDAKCTRCHSDVNGDEVETYPVLPMARTKHGTKADGRTPTCTSCHGESDKHLRRSDKGRPAPDRPFGKKSATDPLAHNQACLTCHEGGKTMHWAGSVHARRDMPCTDCHQMHVQHDRATTREKIADTCMSCHKEKKGQFARASHHPVPEGKMVCTDCHNPHGSAGPKLMVKDSVNETCYSCHMQYRGPFLWNHMPATQDCTLCHNPNNLNDERMSRVEGTEVLVHSVDFKLMIHRIHTGEHLSQPYVLGGNPSPTVANPAGTPVDFSEVRYPGIQGNCKQCHLDGTWALGDGPGLLSTREQVRLCVEAPAADADALCGAASWVPTSTRTFAPAAAACLGCHDSEAAGAHAELNTTASGVEACVVCHGPGSEADVSRVHPIR